MKDPKFEIPRAIIMGGVAIAAIYLFASFGIGAAIPADEIDPDFGMVVAVETMVTTGQVHIAGEVRGFDPAAHGMSKREARRLGRFVQYAIVASDEALAQ